MEIKLFLKSWRKTDWSAFNNAVELPLSLNQHIHCPNDLANLLLEIFSTAVEEAVPSEKRSLKQMICPFFDEELEFLKRHRRKREKFYQKNPSIETKTEFQLSISNYKKVFRKKKLAFFDKNINQNLNLRSKFSNFNQLLGVHGEQKLPKSWGSHSKTAEEFRKYFTNKIVDLRNSIPNPTKTKLTDVSVSSHIFHFSPLHEFKLIEIHKLNTALRNLSNSYCDLDPIPTSVAKQTFHLWSNHFINLANSSFEQGVYPDVFKVAIIKPKLKKVSLDPEVAKNYRPLANTIFFSKLLERLATDELKRYLEENKLLDVTQSAYRTDHSTETCLLKTVNNNLTDLNLDKKVLIIGLDLSAAFDTIDYNIFADILEKRFRITGKCKNWIMSYLNTRKQKVQIGNKFSFDSDVNYGVPQGSILGPLLFTMYITPIGDFMRQNELNYQIYADDTLILSNLSQTDINSQINNITTKLYNLFQVFNEMKLKVNAEKTEIMLISSRKRKLQINEVQLADELLTLKPKIVSLGVILDQHLSMSDHVNSVARSCYNELRKLYKIKHYLTLETRKVAVQNLIISRLDYCNSLLSGINKMDIMKLQRVQNAACRFIFSLYKYESCKDFMFNLHWLPVEKRIDFKILIFVHKIMHNCPAPEYIRSLITLQPKNDSKRSVNLWKAVPVRSKNSYGDRTFSIRGPKLWNNLPINLRKISNHYMFRRELKSFLFTSYYQR